MNIAKTNCIFEDISLSEYLHAFEDTLPSLAKNFLQKCVDNGWKLSSNDILDLATGTLQDVVNIASKKNISASDLEKTRNSLKTLKKQGELEWMPQFQSSDLTKMAIQKKMPINDVVIQSKLSSPKGKNEIVAQYIPLVHKIINQYKGKLKISYSDMLSSALAGTAEALKTWDPKKGNFRTFLSYAIRNAILSEASKLGYALSGDTNWAKKSGNLDKMKAISLSTPIGKDGDGSLEDVVGNLASLTSVSRSPGGESDHWEKIYKSLEQKFSQRDVDIFYRYFGINGKKKEKAKDIAKSYGMSPGNINNSIINKILRWIKKSPDILAELEEIRDYYVDENLAIRCVECGNVEEIRDILIEDDQYVKLTDTLHEIDMGSCGIKLAVDYALLRTPNSEEIRAFFAGGPSPDPALIKTFLANVYPTEVFDVDDVFLLLNKINYLKEILYK